MKKQTGIIIGASLLLAVAAFIGGMQYGKMSGAINPNQRGTEYSLREPSGQRGNFLAAGGQNRSGQNGGRFMMNGAGGGFSVGEILSKDDTSITVKLPDGGSRIIFYAPTTEVSTFTATDVKALEVGKTIMVSGKTNQDGSVTAQTIQIRPAAVTKLP